MPWWKGIALAPASRQSQRSKSPVGCILSSASGRDAPLRSEVAVSEITRQALFRSSDEPAGWRGLPQAGRATSSLHPRSAAYSSPLTRCQLSSPSVRWPFRLSYGARDIADIVEIRRLPVAHAFHLFMDLSHFGLAEARRLADCKCVDV